MSGAVYAQGTSSVAKPAAPTAETAKQKPAVNHVAKESKDKPAAVSGESATPAVKSPKHEHAARVAPKSAVEKSTKSETPDAKKLETTPVQEPKSDLSKPAVKKPADSANKAEKTSDKASTEHKTMKHEASKSAEKSPEASKPVK
jgi:hypothetical protein